jgi:hypothetical protein
MVLERGLDRWSPRWAIFSRRGAARRDRPAVARDKIVEALRILRDAEGTSS